MRKSIALSLAVAGIAVWLTAQALSPSDSKSAMDLMPPGALVYLEARNFNQLLSGWNGSPEKKAWLDSANYQVFLPSHLIIRMTEARKAYLEAASLPESAPLLDALAGGESAIALYNIGKIEFLYTTKLNAGQFAGSALAGARSKFETRKAGNYNYFIRTQGDSAIAYALVNERLFLAMREDLIAAALKLLSGQPGTPLSKESWFADALKNAPTGPADLKVVTDLAHVAKTPQFRSYWIQRNVTELGQYASSIVHVTIANGSIKEDRVLLRQKEAPAEADDLGDVLRYVPADTGFYQAVSKPSPESVTALLKDRLFGSGAPIGATASTIAPAAPDSGTIGGEDDFETRVDLTVETTPHGEDVFAPLAAIAANTDAVLQAGASKLENDQVMVGVSMALVLRGKEPWKLADVQRDLGTVAKTMWAADAWPGNQLKVEGNILILGTSASILATATAKPQESQQGRYIAEYRHAQELPMFERITKMIDFPSIPQGTDTREPLFFSENIASLARVFARLDSISITERDTGAAVQQTAVYKLK